MFLHGIVIKTPTPTYSFPVKINSSFTIIYVYSTSLNTIGYYLFWTNPWSSHVFRFACALISRTKLTTKS